MKKWEKSLSVRTPLIMFIALILIAGFLATNLISYQVSKNSLREALIGDELPLTSDNIYSEIQRDLLQPVFVTSLMASSTFVRDWLLAGERNPDRIIRYLDEIRLKYGVFTSFMVSEKTRNYYHFSGISQVISADDPQDEWYFRVRDMAKNHEINVDINAEQGNTLTIFINQKVFDYDGGYIAAIGVGLDFDTLSNIIDRYKKRFGRQIYFVNEAGRVMVSSSGIMMAEDNIFKTPGIAAIADRLMTADNGFFDYERDGETMLVNTRKIPELNWRVIVEQRESDALAGIRQSLYINLVVGFLVIALTLVIVMYTIDLFHTRLEKMAITDKLTGIGNRSLFDIMLDQALTRRLRDGKPVSIVIVDIDHFKRINDTLGHLEGDRVIREIVILMQQTIRRADILCRWGGDEFVILAYDCALQSAATMAEKIRTAIEAAPPAKLLDDTPVTISAGITEVRDDDSSDTLISRADNALYIAKQEGRNRIHQA